MLVRVGAREGLVEQINLLQCYCKMALFLIITCALHAMNLIIATPYGNFPRCGSIR